MVKTLSERHKSNFERLVKAFGSQEKIAKAIGVTQPAVYKWRKFGVPISRVKKICLIFNELSISEKINPHDFYPDIFTWKGCFKLLSYIIYGLCLTSR